MLSLIFTVIIFLTGFYLGEYYGAEKSSNFCIEILKDVAEKYNISGSDIYDIAEKLRKRG